MVDKYDLKYTNFYQKWPQIYKSKEILPQGGRGRGEKSVGRSGRRKDKDDWIFLEKVEEKMVEMKMAESDNKSGRTQREERG